MFALRGALNQKMILSQKDPRSKICTDRLEAKGLVISPTVSPRSDSPEKPPAPGKMTILLDFAKARPHDLNKTAKRLEIYEQTTAIFQHLSHRLPPAENFANLGSFWRYFFA